MLEKFPDSDYSLSAPEEWAWEQIRRGEVADMRFAPDGGGANSPCKPVEDGWISWAQYVAGRTLSAKFTKTIVTRPQPAYIPGTRRIHIENAVIDQFLDLANEEIEMELWIRNSFLRAGIDINAAHFHRSLLLDGSVVEQRMSSNDAVFDRYLSMGHGKYPEIWLIGAKIGRRLSVVGSTVTGQINADNAVVTDSVFLHDNAIFEQEVRLVGAKIGGQIAAHDSVFKGQLSADDIEVNGDMFLRYGAVFEKAITLAGAKIGGDLSTDNSTFNEVVYLHGAKIGGNISAIESTFEKEFNADNVEVAGNVFLCAGAKFESEVSLIGAKINGLLLLNNARFAGELSLESAQITRALFLFGYTTGYSNSPKWNTTAKLTLRNAYAGSLRAQMPGSWLIDKEDETAESQQVRVDLVGFSYGRLDLQGIEQIDPHALLAWIKSAALAGQYTPQPYAQLAKVLREMGAEDAANVVDIARHDHYYKTLTRPKTFGGKTKYYLKKLWGGLRNQIDRYGVRPWHSLLWFGGIALAGAFVNAFWIFAQPESVCTMHFGLDFWLYFLDCLRYSIENMLPIPGVSGIAHEMTVTSQISAFILLVQKLIGLFLLGIFIRDVVL